jgi:hypothetical protein
VRISVHVFNAITPHDEEAKRDDRVRQWPRARARTRFCGLRTRWAVRWRTPRARGPTRQEVAVSTAVGQPGELTCEVQVRATDARRCRFFPDRLRVNVAPHLTASRGERKAASGRSAAWRVDSRLCARTVRHLSCAARWYLRRAIRIRRPRHRRSRTETVRPQPRTDAQSDAVPASPPQSV